MSEVFLGRQPILNAAKQLFAYELLCRSSRENSASFDSEDQASASVVLNAFIEIGLENVVQQHRAFVKMSRKFLVDGLYHPLPSKRVILSLTRDIEPDAEVIAAATEAARAGYCLALGGYRDRPEMEPLLKLTRFVFFNARELGLDGMKEQVEQLSGRRLALIADRVETHEEFQALKSMGFPYFKGFFFCEPEVMTHRTVPANRLAVMQLLTRVQDPNVPIGEVQEIIERNVSLSYRILRFVNSALYSFPRRIESIRHAVALLGLDRVRDCLCLSLLADNDGKSHELTVLGLVRARMCQLLARSAGFPREEVYFSAGLLSVLDAILDMPMVKVVEKLSVASELREALLDRSGPAGKALNASIGCERDTMELLAIRTFGIRAIRDAYVQAVKWADELNQAMASVGQEKPVGQPQPT